VDSSETRQIGGTGLGMTLVKQILGAHGAQLSVESAGARAACHASTCPWRNASPCDRAGVMPLRLKIIAVASVLLVAFAITTAFSAWQIRKVMEELGSIVDYHIVLNAFTAEVDVITFEYELNARRLLANGDPRRARAIAARQAEIAAQLPRIFQQMKATLAAAVDDSRNDLPDRIRLARVDVTLNLLGRHVPPFLAAGAALQAAVERGSLDEARRLAEGFRPWEGTFGPDLAEVRRTVAELTRDSMSETAGRELHALWLNGVVFLVAAVIGLTSVALLAQRLTAAFRRLLEGTRSVEAGVLTIELPVTSRDEIGQLTAGFNRMIVELRAKERIQDTFGKFLDPRLITRVLGAHAQNGETAERRVVTVFFSDIKGFSTLSEQLTADVIVRLLNGYFTAVTSVIRERNGIVDKFIGDAIMAFWTPPFSPGDQHAAEACLAALAQQAALHDFRRELSNLTGLRRNVPDFRVRMGVATGEVVVGTLGSQTTKSYTVIGDTVNLASRLEGANKLYGTGIMITEDTLRLANNAVEVRDLDLLVVVGKTEPIRVFELLAPAGQLPPEVAELRGIFEEGLAAYRTGQWELAEGRFRECVRLHPDDGPSRTFLERVAVLQAHPPVGWTGVWTMDHK
jgi:adenylate cyclase